jgi:hypothetical protein
VSPRVRLVIHAGPDPAAAAERALDLEIDLPAERRMDDLIAAVETQLRERYPGARIEVGEVAADGSELTWHVYRDEPSTEES